jgi:hypothetical protein
VGSPAGTIGVSQHPLVSAQSPVDGSASASDSSATTKIALFPLHALDDMIVRTVGCYATGIR